jgi:hypothetical protein
MLNWKELTHLPDEELARFDIGEVNLACAAGLHGSDKIDVPLCLSALDELAERVCYHLPFSERAFRENPEHWNHSWAVCRIHTLVRVMHRNQVRYNPAKIPAEATFSTDDTFIHGIIQGEGGTCASLPVFFAAIGRRLGYPLKLVGAKRHLFLRWEEYPDRFNIEINNHSFETPSDDFYRTGLYEITPEQERDGCFLKTMGPREELANFLAQRGFRCWDQGLNHKEVEAFIYAAVLEPENKLHAACAMNAMERWGKKLRAGLPPFYPKLKIHFPAQRRFPTIPESVERQMIIWELTEQSLQDARIKEMWWKPNWQPTDGRQFLVVQVHQ